MLCTGTERLRCDASRETKRALRYCIAHDAAFSRWRKSAAVKGNSFAWQAFLGYGEGVPRVDEFG
jgi:hypothetical protein